MEKNDGKLGLASSVGILTGGMIGSAIFSLSGLTISLAGPAALLSWLIAAATMLFYGLIVAELSSIFPKSGGVFVFPARALGKTKSEGEFWGWISTWGYLNANIVAVAFAAIYVGTYLSAGFQVFGGKQIPLALASIALVLALNYLRISITGKLNFILVFVLVFSLAAFAVVGFSSGEWSFANLSPFFSQGSIAGAGFLAAVPTAMVGYGSIVAAAFMVSEVKNPNKTVPRAVFISTLIVLCLYELVILTVVGLMNAEELRESGMTFIPLYAVAWKKLAGFKWLPKLISISALLALLTTMLVVLALTSRAMQAAAEKGLLPKIFAKNAKTGAPFFSALAISALSAILSFFPDYTALIVSFGALFAVVTISINVFSLLVARRKFPAAEGFRLSGGAIIPVVVLALILICYVQDIKNGGWKIWLFTGIWHLLGILIYKRRKVGKTNERARFDKPLSISGIVVRGKGLGRTVGMPTANLDVGEEFPLPEDGVYGTIVFLDGEKFRGVTNVGRRPTVDSDDKITVETFILDFDDEIYGKRLDLTFAMKIRPVKKFNSLAEVKKQVDLDVEKVRAETALFT